METNKNQEKVHDAAKQRKILRIVCSILVALAIWVYVDEEKTVNVKMSVNDLPVEFASEDTTLADNGLMLLSGYNTTVDLVLKGPRKVLWKLNKDEIRMVADTATARFRWKKPVFMPLTLRWVNSIPRKFPLSAMSAEKFPKAIRPKRSCWILPFWCCGHSGMTF